MALEAIKKEKSLYEERERQHRAEERYLLLWGHEIKTPLAALRLGLSHHDIHREELLPELFRTEEYVDQLLTVLRQEFRQEDFLFQSLELKSFLQERIRRMRHLFFSKNLSVSLDGDQVAVISDRRWLAYVIDQILMNAVKYTDQGRVELSWKQGTLCIRDTGIGISPSDLPRIFDWGFSGQNGRRHGQGTGMGLSLSKEILKRLGGEISVSSTPAEGTSVFLHLPTK